MIRKSLNKEHHEVCSCYPHAHWGSGHSHKASTIKEAEGEGVTEEGASDCSGDSITIGIVWQKKKKLKRRIKKGTQAALQIVGCWAQNWPALLGSHCRRRTMDGSLLAPRMNSSRESFPSLLVSIWRKIFSVLFSGVDSSSGIFMTEETIL